MPHPATVHRQGEQVPGQVGHDGTGRRASSVVRPRTACGVLLAGVVVLGGLSVWTQRGFGLVVDEWDILAHHHSGNYLTPYNGHLSIIPIAIYNALAHTIGIGSYWPYGLVGIVIFLAIPVAFFLTHRDDIDDRLVALASLAIAWSWAAQWNLLYGFLMNFDIPELMLVIAWRLIRDDRPRSDLWAVVALAVALASSSVGVVAVFAIGVELIFRRVPMRRLVRFAPPVIAWLVWWGLRRDPIKPAGLGDKAAYAWHLSVGILAGFTLGWKPGAAVSAVVITAVVIAAWKRWGTLDAHVAAIGMTLLFFIALSAWSRAGDAFLNPPDASRYVWIGNVLVIAALCWCVRGVRIDPRALAALAVVALVGAVALVGHLGDHRRFVQEYQHRTLPYLVEAEAAGPRADPDRILPLNLIPVTVGEYLDLVRDVGSPLGQTVFDSLGDNTARRAADRLFLEDETIRVEPVAQRPECSADPRGWETVTGASSSTGVGVEPGGVIAFPAPRGTQVRVRRLARTFPDKALAVVGEETWQVVRFPDDDSSLPWWVQIRGSDSDVVRCAASHRHARLRQ